MFVAALFYLLAVLLHYPELGVMAAGAVAVLLLGVGWVIRRPNLEIERTIEPTRVTRGEVSLGLLTVRNPGHIAVSPTAGEDHCGDETVAVAVPRLAPGATSHTTYALPTDHRAILEVGPLTIARQDPFGLWRTTQRMGVTERLWIHPVLHSLATIPTGRTRTLDGPDRDALPHGSITFHALREYLPGDDLRHVHWRSSARTGTLMVREHVDTSLPQVTLVLDASAECYSENEFEEAVEVAASIAVTATYARLPVRIVVSSGESIQGRGEVSDAAGMLDLFAGVKRAPHGSLFDTASQLARASRGDVLLVVSGAASIDQMISVGALGNRYSGGVVTIVSENADEVQVPVPPRLRIIRVRRASEFPMLWEQLLTR